MHLVLVSGRFPAEEAKVFQPFLAVGLGVIATTLGFRATQAGQATDEHLNLAGAAKRLMRIVGPMAVLVGVLWAIGATGGRLPRPDPMVVRHTVAFPEFGVQVTLPQTWSLEPTQAGTEFAAIDSETGATLTGAIRLTDSSKPFSVEIDKIIDDHRARFGSGQNSSRGVLALGLLNAQWAELSYFGQATGTRVKTIALRRANRVLALTCSGDDRAQAACEAGIKPEH